MTTSERTPDISKAQ